jgi:hypothetical protein
MSAPWFDSLHPLNDTTTHSPAVARRPTQLTIDNTDVHIRSQQHMRGARSCAHGVQLTMAPVRVRHTADCGGRMFPRHACMRTPPQTKQPARLHPANVRGTAPYVACHPRAAGTRSSSYPPPTRSALTWYRRAWCVWPACPLTRRVPAVGRRRWPVAAVWATFRRHRPATPATRRRRRRARRRTCHAMG